jgi:hypothetical protein
MATKNKKWKQSWTYDMEFKASNEMKWNEMKW